MITKKQVQELQPAPFKPVLAYTRYKNGMIVPNTKPRLKREWSNNGTHPFTLPDGTIEQRAGQYVVKMRR